MFIKPSSPHSVPQLFLMVQYLFLFSSVPQPTIETTWLMRLSVSGWASRKVPEDARGCTRVMLKWGGAGGGRNKQEVKEAGTQRRVEGRGARRVLIGGLAGG